MSGPRPCDMREEIGVPCGRPAVFKARIAVGGWSRDGSEFTGTGELDIAVCEVHNALFSVRQRRGLTEGATLSPSRGLGGEPEAEGT